MIFRDITDTKFKGIKISSYHEFDHEKVYYYEDDNTGIKSLVAIHDSSKGPAIGGCRFKEYDSFEQGLNDVLRLSRGMTHKNNVAQIPFGAFLLQHVCGPVGPHRTFAPPSHPTLGAFRHALCHLPLHGGAVFLLPFILPLQMKVCLRFWRQHIGVPAEAAYPPPQNPPARSPGVFAHVQQWA